MLGFSPLASGPLGAIPSVGATALNGSVDLTLGALVSSGVSVLLINASGNNSLGTLSAVAAGSLSIKGQATAALGGLSIAATGSISSGLTGSLSSTLGALSVTASGTLLLAGALSGSLGSLTSVSTGQVLAKASASITLGGLTASATGTIVPPISGSLSGQLSGLTASATGALVVRGSLSVALSGLTVLASGRSGDVKPIRYLSFLAVAKNILFLAPSKRLAFTAYADGGKTVERTPEKQPEEIWLCALDCSAWIGEGNSIAAFSAQVVSGSVVADSTALLPNGIGRFRLSGGTSKEIAKVRALATMADGQVYGQTFLIPVE